jgi:hypothetical protein
MSVILIERGRLGNQLFQYAAVRSGFRSQAMWLIGFDDLLGVFDGVEARQLLSSKRLAGRLVRRGRPWIDRVLGRIHLVPTVSESTSGRAIRIETTPARLAGPTFVLTAYFQSPGAFECEGISALHIRAALDAAARALLDRISAPSRPRIFVHIRRGDYAAWPSAAEPAILPDGWYHAAMDELRARLSDPFFVLFTDDAPYVGRAFAHVADAAVAQADIGTEFAAMCACDGGILSASSFSWWPAYFINQRSARAPLIAPRFWAGHRRGQWYPPAIETPYLEYRTVPSTPQHMLNV